jgi:hypothetical protein
MKVGETYTFIAKDVEDEHFKKFEYAKCYTIQKITHLSDSDTYGSYRGIIFYDTPYGCLDCYFDKYFLSTQQLRDLTINKLI